MFRRRIVVLWAALALTMVPLDGQTTRIPPNAVVNAAGFMRPSLPNGKIARGSIFSVFGTRIGPGAPVDLSNASFPLSTTLGGVSATVTQGDVVVDVIPVFAADGQVNAIMPSDAPLGRASLRIMNGVRRSNAVPIEIVESSVGVFSATGSGEGPGIVQNFQSQTAQPVNSLDESATPGQVATIWATGLGAATFPDNEAPVAGNLDVDVEVWIGGVPVPPADLLYFGRSPCCAGVDQIIVRIPEQAPLGCYVPLHVRTNNAVLSNTTTIAVTEEGGSCRPSDAVAQTTEDGVGLIALLGAAVEDNVDRTEPLELEGELGLARFRERPPSPFNFDRISALPPAGACTVLAWRGRFQDGLDVGDAGRRLDLGPRLEISSPLGTRNLGADEQRFLYSALLGGSSGDAGFFADLFAPSLFLSPGEYAVSSVGGTDSPRTQGSFASVGSAEWTNQADVGVIDRSQDLAIEWTGDPSAILGVNYDRPTNTTAAFLCRASEAVNNFSVPAYILGALSPSRAGFAESEAWLWVGVLDATEFDLTGIDTTAIRAQGSAKSVIFK